MSDPISAVFVGDGTLLIRCVQAWRDAGHRVVAVASGDIAILDWARGQGIDVEHAQGTPQLEGAAFDYLFSVANLKVLPAGLIERARRMAINFHDGPLPAHAGLNVPAWAVMKGEREHGITWHEMTPQVDRGRIARQARFGIAPDDTAFSLNTRCYEAGHEAFVGLVDDITRGTLELMPQQGTGAWHRRDDRPDALGVLDLSRPASELCALARGLDFGSYANPLALPKLWAGDDEGLWLARSVRASGNATTAAPGTILGQEGDRVRVATGAGELLVHGLRRAQDLQPVGALQAGRVLPALPEAVRNALAQRQQRLARGESTWRAALAGLHALVLPYPTLLTTASPTTSARQPLRIALGAREQGADTLAAYAAWLCAITGQPRVHLSYVDAALVDAARGIEPFVSPAVPVHLGADRHTPVQALREQAREVLARARDAGPMTRDLPLRLGTPAAPELPRVGLRIGTPASPQAPALALELHAETEGGALALSVDAATHAPHVAQAMAAQLDGWLQAFAQARGAVGEISLLPPAEAAALQAFNDTAVPVPLGDVHGAIAQWSRAHADDEALCWHTQRLTHAQLQQRVASFAAALQARGVQPGDVVGVCLGRRPELLVSVLAILRCGAAYLPLDPDYPHERLRFMVGDSGTRLVVCTPQTAALLELEPGMSISPEAGEGMDALPSRGGLGGGSAVHPAGEVRSTSPAYVIYTSGSTGQPKGVVVTHANVLNFFAGMDARVPHEPGARWLAVTSLSFDISVLELLWTLSRGVTVVLHAPEPDEAADAAAKLDFSLFYFSSDEAAETGNRADRYRLLMEGARYADRNGFAAVWTPERHFHAFGGLYPNPAIASAAIAAVTERVQIRAGSVVSPLHPTVRIAEDWALLDNLSNGRVGVSFAAGWQPNDFVIAPQNFANRKQHMLDQIDAVRRLWRGEAVELPGHDGKPVAVRTLPRPVQPMLPVWLTAASNPETFEEAGRKGCNILTHLLGQTVDDVAGKVALYRKAWREAGHAGAGVVSMMLHTFVGDDEDAVRETARGPMKTYLRSSVDLIRQAAWSFPTFVQRGAAAGRTPLEVMQEKPLSPQEMDALLDHAFSRYWNTSALIGTPERCLAMVHKLQDAGVDEIACLVDFGIATDTVLQHLDHLRRLMQLAQRPRDGRAQNPRALTAVASVAQALRHNQVTHLQCTPSMATMLVADAQGRDGLSRLQAMLVGGEALPLPLARQLRTLVPGKLLNMYGPTETTVWSSVCEIAELGEFVPLGEPIANTQLHVRNAWEQECPAYVAGELLIGGDGVTRGYHARGELTAQKFIADPQRPGGRLYRTGDLVRRHADGRIEFLGRLDHQVKIRGHRIELGEIENTLARQPGVREAVVVAQQDAAGEAFLVGYVTPADAAAPPQAEQLRASLAQALPEIMVPRRIALRASFPLTPNGKVDRKALLAEPQDAPAAATVRAVGGAGAPVAAPEDPLERTIAGIWSEVLGTPEVGRDSNFFDLGGHSLLVIQVQRRLKDALGQEISITDMFRLSTVAAIAEHLRGDRTREAVAVNEGLSRAQARRALRGRARVA